MELGTIFFITLSSVIFFFNFKKRVTKLIAIKIVTKMTTILKYGLCISVIFARNKIVFGEIKNEEGISLASVNIFSIHSQIGAQSNGKGYFSEMFIDGEK